MKTCPYARQVRHCVGIAIPGAKQLNNHQRISLTGSGLYAGIGLALSLTLSGCAVGPDFRAPDAPAGANGNAYTPTPISTQTDSAQGFAGDAQRFASGKDIPADWWTVFHSNELDQLVRAAFAHNPSMAGAQAALRQAQENLKAEGGSLLYPNVTGQLGAERQHASAVSTFTPSGEVFNVYTGSLNVSYTVDVFGATRRTLEGLQAAVDYQRYQLEATYITLSSNVVVTAIREASARGQLKATKEVLESQEKELAVIEKQYAIGAIPRTTLLTQRNQVAQIRVTLPPLEKALAQAQHQLSVYVGKLPSESGMPEFDLETLQLPQELPVSLPSNLVRQRPDIRASEALLHEASAQVGVATANQYPQITLSGSYGAAALTPGKLFNGNSTFWSLGAGLTAPLFNAGSLSAKRRAAVAAYDQASAQYQTTVLGAFQNVADTLRALESDATTLKAQMDVEALARESMELTTKQYHLGGTSYLVLVDAERNYQQAHVALVQAQAARYTDTAALFQALGGGWWNRPAPTDTAAVAANEKKN
jgi:NodT family efflux transporter outer membrane factor (OMF) lipoprotein